MMVKELDKQFEKKGEIFTQIEKGDNYYIYKRDMKDSVCYEVFERRTVKLNDFWRKFDTKGKYIKTYNNIWEIKKELKNICHIYDCCRGERKTAYGFVWKYEE